MATPTGVAFNMTARSILFGRRKRDIHVKFAHADLREVDVHSGRASIGVVRRSRKDETQRCQGYTSADEVDASLAALVQHDVEGSDRALANTVAKSVVIGRYSGSYGRSRRAESSTFTSAPRAPGLSAAAAEHLAPVLNRRPKDRVSAMRTTCVTFRQR